MKGEGGEGEAEAGMRVLRGVDGANVVFRVHILVFSDGSMIHDGRIFFSSALCFFHGRVIFYLSMNDRIMNDRITLSAPPDRRKEGTGGTGGGSKRYVHPRDSVVG